MSLGRKFFQTGVDEHAHTSHCTCYCGKAWFGIEPPPPCCPKVCAKTRHLRKPDCGHTAP